MDSERAHFRRHYDYLLWYVSSIFLVAIGVLLTVFFTSSESSEKIFSNFRFFIALVGLGLTLSIVWFAAGFREMRYKYRDRDEEKEIPCFKQRSFPQWGVYLFIFGALSTFWLYLLVKLTGELFGWIVAWVFILGYFIYVYKMAAKPLECCASKLEASESTDADDLRQLSVSINMKGRMILTFRRSK